MTDEKPAPKPRSKRIYVYWGVALALLVTVGLLCWLVVVPYMRVERELDELWAMLRASGEVDQVAIEKKKRRVAALGYRAYARIVDRYLGRGAHSERAAPLAYIFEVNEERTFEMLVLYVEKHRGDPEAIGAAVTWASKLDKVPLVDRLGFLEDLLANKGVCGECDPLDPKAEYRLPKVHRERVCDRALMNISMLLKGKAGPQSWASRQIEIHSKHDNGSMSEADKWKELDALIDDYRKRGKAVWAALGQAAQEKGK